MIWHPAKWWYQQIDGNLYAWPGQGEPPGLLDSGRYWLDSNGIPQAPMFYKCLSCCCTPAKCEMPSEILMTISGFAGTLSSVDRPAAYGYGPGNVCPECEAILWSGSDFEWTNYPPECCVCRKNESFYWWPRHISGPYADGADMCSRPREICSLFPSLCTGVPQPTQYSGRIAGRFIKPCTTGCTDFIFADDHPGVGVGYSVVELTDCAKAPGAVGKARQDYNCIMQSKIDVVINHDSYLPPPGFRGPGSVNLLPLCENQFWNDPTYYRFCADGGFWCQGPKLQNPCYCALVGGNVFYNSEEDFFWHLTGSIVANDGWRTSTWCEESPTRCKGPVKVGDIHWRYYRPNIVLISQPSVANCSGCPRYGAGYGSSFSNYGIGTDWYDPYDDGNCIGKTDVAMEDFNTTFMMNSEINEAPPYLCTVLKNRTRAATNDQPRVIDAQLLYQLTHYAQNEDFCDCVLYDHQYWRVDYPCEPKEYVDEPCKCYICDRTPGQVAPKLRAFYTGDTGSGVTIEFTLKNFCPPVSLAGYGPNYNGSWWYVASIAVAEDEKDAANTGGGDYKNGDKFVFDYYESPARGGESIWTPKGGPDRQYATVTKVDDDGKILEIVLDRPADFYRCQFTSEVIGESIIYYPIIPIYCRFLTHRYAVGIPGNLYREGDLFEFQNLGAAPENTINTGNKYFPYLKTATTYKSRARATVLEVDSRGGVVDWYMCGAQNTYPWNLPRISDKERECSTIDTGKYYDFKYENKCQYNYIGFVPVRYAWSGFADYQFHRATYCEHAWAEFSFQIDQISVKNTVVIEPPPTSWGKPASLRIKRVGQMTLYGQTIEPLAYQNYETSPGPNANASGIIEESTLTYFKNHKIPVDQGRVIEIEVVNPGSGYVKKIEHEDGTYEWRALEMATYFTPDYPYCLYGCRPAMAVRGVADDIRGYMAKNFGWPSFCVCKANIKMDVPETHPLFGSIESITIEDGGLWYFAHEHDHVWMAKAGSNWYFEMASPAVDGEPVSPGLDYANSFGYDCWHASRDNWGVMHHFDGFYEPYASGYHQSVTQYLDANDQPQTYVAHKCEIISPENAANYVWPINRKSITGSPGLAGAGDYKKRWSTNFCPNDLLNKSFRMILVHPCAACAKEQNIPGGQSCWNMNGAGDTTYNVYPGVWGGTGTAMITRLAGDLTFTVAVPTAD